jgi:hypothetical protein
MKPKYTKALVLLATSLITVMAIYMKFTTPSPIAQCNTICAKSHRMGNLVYRGPPGKSVPAYRMDRDCSCS